MSICSTDLRYVYASEKITRKVEHGGVLRSSGRSRSLVRFQQNVCGFSLALCSNYWTVLYCFQDKAIILAANRKFSTPRSKWPRRNFTTMSGVNDRVVRFSHLATMSGRDRILISPQHSSRGARPDGRYDMRSSRVITDDRLSQNEEFSLMKSIRRCVEWAGDHVGLGLI